jgi:hypothetical protein
LSFLLAGDLEHTKLQFSLHTLDGLELRFFILMAGVNMVLG